MLGNLPLQAAVILLVHKKGLLTGNGLNRIHKTGMSWFLTGNMYKRTKSEGLKKKLNGHTGEWYSLNIWFPCKELMKIWLYYSVLSTFKSEYAEKIPLDCRAGQWYRLVFLGTATYGILCKSVWLSHQFIFDPNLLQCGWIEKNIYTRYNAWFGNGARIKLFHLYVFKFELI